MTAYRMVDVEHPPVRQILRDMEKFQPMGQHILNKTNVINVRNLITLCLPMFASILTTFSTQR